MRIDFEPLLKRDKKLWQRLWLVIGGSLLCVALIGCVALKNMPRTVTIKRQLPRLPNQVVEPKAEAVTLTIPQDPARYANSKRDRMKFVWDYNPDNKAYQIWFWQNNEWRFGFYTLTNECVITNSGGMNRVFQPFRIVPQDIHGNPGIHTVKLPPPI